MSPDVGRTGAVLPASPHGRVAGHCRHHCRRRRVEWTVSVGWARRPTGCCGDATTARVGGICRWRTAPRYVIVNCTLHTHTHTHLYIRTRDQIHHMAVQITAFHCIAVYFHQVYVIMDLSTRGGADDCVGPFTTSVSYRQHTLHAACFTSNEFGRHTPTRNQPVKLVIIIIIQGRYL